MEIRQRLELRIKASGMTKKEFAEKMDAHPGSFNSLLEKPSWTTLERIAKVLGVDVDDLFVDHFLCPHCGKPIKITLE